MKTALLVLGLTIAAAYSTVVPVKSERKVADATFLKRQKQILDLFVGVGHNEYFQHEFADFDITAHSDQFYDYKVVDEFWYAYKRGYLPKDGVFSMSSHLTRKQTIYLFDVFFFAKDFDTFYKCAVWAKKHIHPMMFAYAYTLALMHREDCHYYELPPLYEIFPTYFVPQETFQKIYDARMYGHKEAKFTYNNTGYEYNYHTSMFGGPFGYDAYEPHLDYKVSYFREDVGNNAYYAMWQLRYPSWMSPEKYKKSYWFKRGEGFYYTHQQLFARYSLERLANGLPYVEPLYWDKPIKVGYTPRIFHYNGYPFYTRPDNYEPKYFNKYYVQKAQDYERRIYDAIDEGQFWFNDTRYYINDEEGVDKLGQVIYGAYYKPNQEYYGSYDKKNQDYYGPYDKSYQEYYGSYYYASLNALGYAVKTSNDHSYIGGAMTYPGTSLRDPAFFNYLNRLVWLFQYHKKNFKPYTQKELGFPGVVVKDFEVDKLLTYFERYDYEVSNAIPVKDYKEYFNMKYFASQWRLNHKPFTYKVTVNSDNAYEGMVRIFIGPKYDSEEHDLTLEQKRMLMVEFDRFPVKMVAGVNLFERNYKDSPVYTNDNYGFRQLYSKINNAMNSQEPYYYYDHKVSCGVPDRFQLPRGWKNGQPFTFYVVVSPFEKKYNGESKDFYTTCGSSKLYDYRPLGFPFDRPIYESEWKVPNIFYKDVPVYHKGEYDIYQKEY